MSDIKTVRLLVPDKSETDPIFSDDEIESFLNLAGGKVFLAAAYALEVVAADEALVYKIVTTDDLSVNGVTGATQVLMVRAKTLRSDQIQSDALITPNEAFQLVFPDQGTSWPL